MDYNSFPRRTTLVYIAELVSFKGTVDPTNCHRLPYFVGWLWGTPTNSCARVLVLFLSMLEALLGGALLERAGYWSIALKDVSCSGLLPLCFWSPGGVQLCLPPSLVMFCLTQALRQHSNPAPDWHFQTMSLDKSSLLFLFPSQILRNSNKIV